MVFRRANEAHLKDFNSSGGYRWASLIRSAHAKPSHLHRLYRVPGRRLCSRRANPLAHGVRSSSQTEEQCWHRRSTELAQRFITELARRCDGSPRALTDPPSLRPSDGVSVSDFTHERAARPYTTRSTKCHVHDYMCTNKGAANVRRIRFQPR